MALDSYSRVHISYYDNTLDDLKHIYTPGPPLAEVMINSGKSYTGSRYVNLNLSAQSAPTQMIISENVDFSDAAWETYIDNKSFTLSSDKGAKTIYAKFRDQWQTESNAASDLINYVKKPKFVTKNPKALEILINQKWQEYEAGDFVFLFKKLPAKFTARKYYLQVKKSAKYLAKYGQEKQSTIKKYWLLKTNFNKYRPKKGKNNFKIKLIFRYTDSELAALIGLDEKLKEGDLVLKQYNFRTKNWEIVLARHNKNENIFIISKLTPKDFWKKRYYIIGKK
jgi:hypothetical protein